MARARRERRWSDQAPARAASAVGRGRRGSRADRGDAGYGDPYGEVGPGDGYEGAGYDGAGYNGAGYDHSGYDYGEDDGWVGYPGDGEPTRGWFGRGGRPGRGGRLGRLGRSADSAELGPPARWHAGVDAALLLLRAAVATAAIGHGAQVLVGAFGGPGLDGYARQLAGQGYAQATLLAGLSSVLEVGAGLLVLAGLFTAPAASVLLVVLVNAFLAALPGGFLPGPAAPGAQPHLVLAAAAAALVLTGGGRLALDPMFPLLRRPHLVGPPLLLLALAAAATVRALLHAA